MKALSSLPFLCLLAAAASAAELPPSVETRIDELCAAFLRTERAPGISVAVGLGNEMVFEKGYGFADVENKVPASAKTRYRTASIAKSVAAVIALHLMEEGKLDLEAPVQKYVAEFPEKPWPVNSRQLLAHLSGIRHYARAGEAAGKRRFNSLRGALVIFADDPLMHEPDTKYLYSSYGYNLLGAVSESAAGESFAILLERIVTKPAGMAFTTIDDQERVIPDRTRGYALRHGILSNCDLHDTSMKIPGGGLLATPADLVRFLLAVNGGKLLKPETVERMWTRQRTRDGKETEYGLGWRIIGSEPKIRLIGHSGGQAGTTTQMLLHPASGVAVAVMCNLERAKIPPLTEQILREFGIVPPSSPLPSP